MLGTVARQKIEQESQPVVGLSAIWGYRQCNFDSLTVDRYKISTDSRCPLPVPTGDKISKFRTAVQAVRTSRSQSFTVKIFDCTAGRDKRAMGTGTRNP